MAGWHLQCHPANRPSRQCALKPLIKALLATESRRDQGYKAEKQPAGEMGILTWNGVAQLLHHPISFVPRLGPFVRFLGFATRSGRRKRGAPCTIMLSASSHRAT